MLDGIDSEPVDIRLTDPVAVRPDENVDEFGASDVVVIRVVFQRRDVAVLVLGIHVVPARADLASPMV